MIDSQWTERSLLTQELTNIDVELVSLNAKIEAEHRLPRRQAFKDRRAVLIKQKMAFVAERKIQKRKFQQSDKAEYEKTQRDRNKLYLDILRVMGANNECLRKIAVALQKISSEVSTIRRQIEFNKEEKQDAKMQTDKKTD